MYSRPKISVIIPVYNVEAYLQTCLDSVAGQTFKDLEVILVNDGSTDGSSRIIETFKKRYSHFMCLEQTNQGVSEARRRGLSHAEGDGVLFLDADDFLPASYCERLWTAREKTGADLVVGPLVRYHTDSKEAVPEYMHVFSRPVLEGAEKAVLFENFSAAMALCGKLITRDLLERARPEFPAYRTGDDILPSVQLIVSARKIAPVREAVYFYRQTRPGSQSSAGEGRFAGLFNGFLAARNYLEKTGVYAAYAASFEYIRLVCLTSFMETYGLSSSDETLLRENRDGLLLPLRLFRDRKLRFRARVRLLKWCLRAGVSYAACMRQIRRSRRWLFKDK